MEIEKLEKTIKYKFKNESLLKTALLHRSGANEKGLKRIDSNERLEFLGDAVLELVSSKFLFEKYSDVSEGELTVKRASMVCEPALAFCAKKINLEKYIILGKGEEKTGGRKRPSIVSDAMEALIGAIYLDAGYDKASDFIVEFILNGQDDMARLVDSKSKLQEKVQEKGEALIEYKLIGECGPAHNKRYVVSCIVNGKECGVGEGRSKKLAEKEAASMSLKNIN